MCQIITLAYHSLIPEVEIFQEFSKSIRGLPIAIIHQYSWCFFVMRKLHLCRLNCPQLIPYTFNYYYANRGENSLAICFIITHSMCLIFLSSFPFAFSCPLTNDDSWMFFCCWQAPDLHFSENSNELWDDIFPTAFPLLFSAKSLHYGNVH